MTNWTICRDKADYVLLMSWSVASCCLIFFPLLFDLNIEQDVWNSPFSIKMYLTPILAVRHRYHNSDLMQHWWFSEFSSKFMFVLLNMTVQRQSYCQLISDKFSYSSTLALSRFILKGALPELCSSPADRLKITAADHTRHALCFP